jgi:hypothetical protein
MPEVTTLDSSRTFGGRQPTGGSRGALVREAFLR